MFIPEEEAVRRITSPENLVTRRGSHTSRSIEEDSKFISSVLSEDLPTFLPVPEEAPILSPSLEKEHPPSHPDRSFGEISPRELSERELEKMLSGDKPYAGRGTKALGNEVRAAIGVTAGILGTTKASRLNDVSIPAAHSYERGYTGPNDLSNPEKKPKEALQAKIIEGHGVVVDIAFGRLLKTLNLLDDDKLGEVKRATELSQIAKNLSGVVAHATQATQDRNTEVNEKNVHFHIMRPEQAIDADYKTIEISSEREEQDYQNRNRES